MNLVVRDESEEENEEEGKFCVGRIRRRRSLNQVEDNVFRAITKLGKRPKFEVDMFLGNLNPNELINWINELEEYFEYEDIEDPNRVKFVKAKLKGHAKIWWQEIQLEMNRRGKEKITRWDHMVDKLKK